MCASFQDFGGGSSVISKGASGDSALRSFICLGSWSPQSRSTCPFPSGNYSLFPAWTNVRGCFPIQLGSIRENTAPKLSDVPPGEFANAKFDGAVHDLGSCLAEFTPCWILAGVCMWFLPADVACAGKETGLYSTCLKKRLEQERWLNLHCVSHALLQK